MDTECAKRLYGGMLFKFYNDLGNYCYSMREDMHNIRMAIIHLTEVNAPNASCLIQPTDYDSYVDAVTKLYDAYKALEYMDESMGRTQCLVRNLLCDNYGIV